MAPKFVHLVLNAIRKLQENEGSSPKEISDYLSREYNLSNTDIKKQVRLTLHRGVSYGLLQKAKGGTYLQKNDRNGEIGYPCPWMKQRFQKKKSKGKRKEKKLKKKKMMKKRQGKSSGKSSMKKKSNQLSIEINNYGDSNNNINDNDNDNFDNDNEQPAEIVKPMRGRKKDQVKTVVRRSSRIRNLKRKHKEKLEV